MSLELARFRDMDGLVFYSIIMGEDKYEVIAHSIKDGRIVSRQFDKLTDAYKAFDKVVFKMDEDKDRLDFIENGTME